MLEAAEADKADLERRLRSQIEALEARNAEFDADVRMLRDQKYALDSRVSELSHQLGSSQVRPPPQQYTESEFT